MQPLDGLNKPMTQKWPNASAPAQAPASGLENVNGALPPGYPPPPAALSATPSLEALLMALKRRWVLAVTLGVAAGALAVAAVAVLFPPKYVAQARLELASRTTRPIVASNTGELEVDPTIYRANQQAIIKSPLVLSRALNNDKLKGMRVAGQSVDALENALKVDFTQGPEIMTIKLYGNDPEGLAELLNAVVAAYIDEIKTRDNLRKDLLLRQLDKTLRDSKADLDKERNKLHKEEEEKHIDDALTMQFKFNSYTNEVGRAETALYATSSTLSLKELELKAKEARLKNIDKEPISQLQVRKLLDQQWSLQHYFAKIALVDESISDHKKTGKDNEALQQAIKRLEDQKAALEANAKEAEKKIKPDIEKRVRMEMEEDLRHDTRQLADLIDDLKIMEKSLNQELQRRQKSLKDLSDSTRKGVLTVEQMREDIKQREKTQDILAGQVALLRAEPSAASKVLPLQAAETPQDKDFSRLVKVGTAGGFGAFGVLVFGVAFLEFRLRKINGPLEVTQGLGFPLIGTMPRLPIRARRPIHGTATPVDMHWQGVITESIDAVRTQLLHAARTNGTHIVMVTSAAGGEGKTSLASQLAASLARSWRKTLLVDSDLRNPAAHKLFDLPLDPGFCEVLRGEANIADVVKPTLLSRLWLLPAGQWDAHAIQALAQESVRTKFEQMKEQYDFIIVDSCPVLPVADSLLLAQHVDAVIFSVLRDVSRLTSLYAAQQKLHGLGVKVIGAVVIGTDADPGSLAYRYTTQANS